jgi:hypothetical protein
MAREEKILSSGADMKRSFSSLTLMAFLLLSACHSLVGDKTGSGDSAKQTGKDSFLVDPSNPRLPAPKHNPEYRAVVRKEPIAEYTEKTHDALNRGDFTVRLFETSKTMYYLAKMEFEGLPGEDTIKFPDIGAAPHPVLQKGKDPYSCIIGLLDNDQRFRELKLVYVTDHGNQLKIRTLKHYVVMNHFRLVGQ